MNAKTGFSALYACLFALSLLLGCGEKSTSNSSPAPTPPTPSKTGEEAPPSRKTIVFFGNSLTAAYGLDPEQGFVSLLQARIDSLGLPWQTVNAGLSGETSAGGLERVDWILRQPVDIFVLELGGNDGLRGIDPAATYANLAGIIRKVKAAYPDARIVLAGMEAPPNMGPRFTSEFRAVFPRLAREYDLPLIPFLLEGVGGVPELNLPDGIHPNAQGQKIVAENVWKVLEPLLKEG
ncbi:MAG: arylesterase [Bacteroidetes bacterium]|nr:MAG: arylesterase [Bacteroidota bacterium]